MEAMILKFVASARAAGIRISTSETLDCLAQLPRVDVLDERQFSTILRANFAKSRLERARFDHLYQLFFHEIREDLDPDLLFREQVEIGADQRVRRLEHLDRPADERRLRSFLLVRLFGQLLEEFLG